MTFLPYLEPLTNQPKGKGALVEVLLRLSQNYYEKNSPSTHSVVTFYVEPWAPRNQEREKRDQIRKRQSHLVCMGQYI